MRVVLMLIMGLWWGSAGIAAGGAPCGRPAVNKIGFRPDAIVRYTTAPSPGARAFPVRYERCVDRAFVAWTLANRASGLHVRFERGVGGIVVRLDRAGGLALRPGSGGAWAAPVRSIDGHLERADIWLSSNPRLLDSCEGVTKLLLHEIGHLHGLDDLRHFRGPSVMNRAARRNDSGGRIPLAPTRCDARQARLASLAGHAQVAHVGR